MEQDDDNRAKAAATIGKDLLEAMIEEFALLQCPWQKLAQDKQQDVIDRLRKRIVENVANAVHLIASNGATTVFATIESVNKKDGIKATMLVSSGADGRHELFDMCGGGSALSC